MRINLLYDPTQETQVFAAGELKNYLERMYSGLEAVMQHKHTGTDALVLEAGPGETDPDAYDIAVDCGIGYIKGSNSRSVLLGVYRYLYLLGCRFLRPGREFEVVPRLSGPWELSAAERKQASFAHRGVCIEGADSEENIQDFIDWLPKLGCNSFFLQFREPYIFLQRWYGHENNNKYQKQPFALEDVDQISARLDTAMRKRGLIQHRVGHGWTGEVLGRPVFSWGNAQTAPNPDTEEFPALINGRREYFHGIPVNTNLCYSNPRVAERFIEAAADYAQEHPDVNYLHIWLADDCNNHCECPSCALHTPTDLYIRLLNGMDEEFTRRGLSTKIVFLLYLELLWPPQTERLRNEKRFVLMFAPISRTFMHSYQDRKQSGPLPEYVRNRISLPSGLEENLAFLKEWRKKFHGSSFVYDYPLGRAHYGDLGYVHISRIIYEDIHAIRELGLNGYISCQELRAALPNALPNYVMGMALFDDALSLEEITEDYYSHAYGEPYKTCFRYLSMLSSCSDCDYFNGKGERVQERIARNMEKALTLLEEIGPFLEKHRNPGDPVRKQFWDHLSYHREYCVLLADALRALAGGQDDAPLRWEAFAELITDAEEEYQKCLDVYRVLEIGLNYTGFK